MYRRDWIVSSYSIQSVTGRRRLDAFPAAQDIGLILTSGELRLDIQFSSLMRTSLGRPWDYRPLEFDKVGCRVHDGRMVLEGWSRLFDGVVEFEFDGALLRCACTWTARQRLVDAGVGLVIQLHYDVKTEHVTLPMSIYNGNPSLDPGSIAPRLPRSPGASFVEEESRFPIPCANVEWSVGNVGRFVSLFSIPDQTDAEWSLGAHRPSADGILLMAACGSVSFNGAKDENYGAKNRGVKIESGYRQLAPGEAVRKAFAITFDSPVQEGWGFRDIVHTGHELLRPHVRPAMDIQEVLRLKTAALDERWHESADAAGFLCVADDNIYRRRPYFLWGWTGQSFKMALCSAREGFEKARPELIERARKCVSFFLEGSRTQTRGLHYNRYLLDKGEWVGEEHFKEERFSSRALGETFWNLSKLIMLFASKGAAVPDEWKAALSDAADFFTDARHLLDEGIPPVMWLADGRSASLHVSSAGTACCCAVLGAYEAAGDRKYLRAAQEMVHAYWRIGGDKFHTPFSKATLDSGCEDKEAAVPFFIAAAKLYELTGDPQYKLWAEVAGDWLLTWVYFWDVKLNNGSICEQHGFRTTGWPSVSVENQHLDVFFPSYEMYDFGRKHGNRLFETMGKAVFGACSHGISRGDGDWFFDKPGRQGEQYFQTRWGFSPPVGAYPEKFREHFRRVGITGEHLDQRIWDGGYNPWDTSWIIVMVLDAAQRFAYDK